MVAIVLSIYGGYSLIYNLSHQKNISILGLVFFIVGTVMLVVFLILYIISFFQKKKNKVVEQMVEPKVEEEPQIEEIKEPEPVEKEDEEPEPETISVPRRDVKYEPVRNKRSFSGGSAYIKKVGYGPVLRVEEEEILDMCTNTYYRIEGNIVKRSGSGPVFEISGNRIRDAFGSYLFEISGGNVNKIYGGYYASISGSSIQIYDLSERYEISGYLNLKQQLAVVAILFGVYY